MSPSGTAVIVAPTSRSHLQLLSRLSAALHDPQFRRVLQARQPDQVLTTLRRVEKSFARAEPSPERA